MTPFILRPVILLALTAGIIWTFTRRAEAQPPTTAPEVSVLPAIGFEPKGGPLVLKGSLRLSSAAAGPVTVSWATADGTALAGTDYTAASGEVTLPAGSLSASLEVTLLPDAAVESTETFSVRITAVTGAAIATGKADWTIRDTDRPAVAHIDDVRLYENGPSPTAGISLYPAGAPFSVEYEGMTPALMGYGRSFHDFGIALYGVDWTTPSATFSAGDARVSYTQPQFVMEDALFEQNETAAVRMKLPAGVVSANFGPRLVEAVPEGGRAFYLPSTDGNWVAVARIIRGLWTVPTYKRSPGAGGQWQAAGVILPKAIGRTDFLGIYPMLRAGRLLLLHPYGHEAWFFHPGDPEGNTWVMEAHIEAIPPFPTYLTSMGYDGETFASDSGSGNLLLINRNGGLWNTRQTIPLPHSSGESRILLSLEEGRLAFHLRNSTPRSAIGFAQRTGPPEAPWVVENNPFTPAFPAGTLDLIEGIQMKNDVLIVTYHSGASTPPFHLLRRTDSGAWGLEQILTDVRAMDKGVIIGGDHVYADIGPAEAPWQSVGSTDLIPFDMTDYEFNAGIFVSAKEHPAFTALSISEAGANSTIIDEDNFEITASSPPLFAEFPAREIPLVVGISAAYPAPVDITVPYETVPGGTALPEVDYRPVKGIATIRAGETGAAIPIPILPDSLVEGQETIVIQFGTPSYGKVVPPLTATVKDSALGARVAAPERPVFVPEPAAGSETYTIPFRLLQTSTADLAVRYEIIAQSATAADVTVVSGKLVTVPAGSSIIPIPLTVLADSLSEDTEQVRINVYALGPVSITSVGTVVSIDDLPSGGNLPDAYTASQGAGLDFDPSRNVLSNDTSGLTSVALARPASYGTVNLKSDGTFSYLPPVNFTGTDRFAYAAGGGAFTLPGTTTWKWLHPLRGRDPGLDVPGFQANWTKAAFDDSSWKTGTGLMGYGVLGSGTGITIDTNIGTPLESTRYTAYFRTAFEVPALPAAGVTVEFSCDDAAIFYLNGSEIGRYAKASAGTFATAADTYTLLSPTFHDMEEETQIRRVFFPAAQLQAGQNTFAISVHNQSPASSDLGLRVYQIAAGALSAPVYVTITVQDTGLPPVVVPDTFNIAAAAYDLTIQRLPASLVTAGSVYKNDGLLSAAGIAYDPILEVETGGNPVGPVTFDKNTGHFSFSVPDNFFGPTSFTYRVRDKDGWSNEAVVTLNIGASRYYDSWRLGYFEAGSASPLGLPGGDEDGDGTANLLEFVFGTNPLAASTVDPLKLSWTGESWKLTITAKTGFGRDAFLGVESSDSLTADSWKKLASLNDYYINLSESASGVIRTQEHLPQDVWQCQLTLPASIKPGTFFRLRASREPLGVLP